MAATSFSSFLFLFLLSQLISIAFTSMHGFIDDPVVQQVVSPDSHDDLLGSAERQFLAFKRKYGKTYPTEEEEDFRFGVFMSNLRQARRNQINDPTAVHGVTKFSDLTPSEFQRKYLGSSPPIETPNLGDCDVARDLPTDGLPLRWNWVENETVTPVKDQENCNGCWAFSTIAVIEGAHSIANKELVNLSEKQLIDCSAECSIQHPNKCNNACDGGYRVLAFRYVKESGVVKEEHYHFSSARECKVQNKPAARIHSYSCIDKEEQYKPYLVEYGPIAVNINADLLQTYVSKVVCHKSDNNIAPHAVTLVGYDDNGTDKDGKPQFNWIVKNSYGTNWGEDGYFRVCKGIINEKGMGIYAIAEKKTAGFLQPN